MRHCDKCDVDIVDEINNCPLCGRDVSNGSEVMTQSFKCYPDNKVWISKRNATINVTFWLTMIFMVISIFVELLLFKRIHYNWYVVTGVALFVIDFIMPMKFRWSFFAVAIVGVISICAYIIFLELFTNSFGWGLHYAIPMFILFATLYSTSIILSRNYQKYEFVICLLNFAILSLGVFLFNLFTKAVIWPSLVAFLTSTTCFTGFLMFRFRHVKNELEKSFFI